MKRQVSGGTGERCEWVKIHLRAEREVGRSDDLEWSYRERLTRSYQPELPLNYPQIPPLTHSIPIPQQSI
jgi:hypothetical protein